ncbi:phage terminase large subunit [Variovorax sp. PAMC26660]|uniref:phage terminase large subunit n=1 Tax=Variovorax sp. PAMC26660 TaxID=2762322 RepID=UPI00164E0931|nr:phage terminase large subunit [Variovorax sp. PAMC26660]QNK65891.1 phage terminase large subunit [Variovorax sp. PAMC26660]
MTNSQPSQQEAARELLIRRKARSDIQRYVSAIDVPGRPVSDDDPDTEIFQPVEVALAHHHRLLLQKLDEVSKTPHGRMMVFMPPGSAKSTYASVVFPSKYLGEVGKRKLILASYGDDLARKMGRRTRSIVKQPRYNGIFKCGLTVESQAAQEFSLTNGSEYMACGILGGVTGNRANGIIIDDPIKGREQANSETVRAKTWDAYEDDLKTRLIPGGWIVLIQTRWHEDDLAGRILPEGWNGESGKILCKDGNHWEVLCLQARCEVDSDPLGRVRGEYLWPEWFDRKHWAQFEQNPRTWSALYQQRPSPLDGDLFKPDQIKVIEALPAGNIKWVRGWDLASTVDGDWTVGLRLGRTEDGRFIISDVRRMRVGPDERDAAMVNTAAMDGRSTKQSIPQDPGQAGKTQVLYLTRAMAGASVVSSPESGDKVTRAEPAAAQVNVGNVSMLRADWNQPFVNELRSFPNGANDDQADAFARAFAELIAPRRSFFG